MTRDVIRPVAIILSGVLCVALAIADYLSRRRAGGYF